MELDVPLSWRRRGGDRECPASARGHLRRHNVSSLDVIHSFWIPRFAGKIDAVPGHVNVLRIQADEPGRYEGQCSEFCGIGHALMRFAVIVHPAKDFSAALAQAAASSPASSKAKE